MKTKTETQQTETPKPTWRLTRIKNDDPYVRCVYTFPEFATIREVQERLEALYSKLIYIDWTISMEDREVKCFIHAGRYARWRRDHPGSYYIESDEE